MINGLLVQTIELIICETWEQDEVINWLNITELHLIWIVCILPVASSARSYVQALSCHLNMQVVNYFWRSLLETFNCCRLRSYIILSNYLNFLQTIKGNIFAGIIWYWLHTYNLYQCNHLILLWILLSRGYFVITLDGEWSSWNYLIKIILHPSQLCALPSSKYIVLCIELPNFEQ